MQQLLQTKIYFNRDFGGPVNGLHQFVTGRPWLPWLAKPRWWVNIILSLSTKPI